MPPQLDEKKRVIIALLDCLRLFNPQIGRYEKSIYTEDFDYSVKLTNGRIRLPEEAIQDFEISPLTVKDEVYQMLAKRFVSNEPMPQPEAIPQNTSPKPIRREEYKRPTNNLWKALTVAILCLTIGSYWCTNAQKAQERDMARESIEKEYRNAQAKDSLKKQQEKIEKEHKITTARVNIYDQVFEENNNYQVDNLFGGISGLTVTVTNNSDYTVDMVKVKVNYIKKSGELYKEEYVYFNKISPHSSLSQPAPDSNRGTSVTIERLSLTCAELSLY